VRATAQGEALVIENQRSETIWFQAIGTSVIPTISVLPPSLQGDSILAGQERTIDLDTLPLGEHEESISVSWWGAVDKNGMRVAGQPSSFQVNLKDRSP
jgi:hypothetical protein